MQIRTRMCMSADGYVTTPDGWPAQLADPAFVPGESYGFPEFQESCDAALMGRTTFEPALSADRWAVAEPGRIRARLTPSVGHPRPRGHRKRPSTAAAEAPRGQPGRRRPSRRRP